MIERVVFIQAPPEDVFEMFTDPELMALWKGRRAWLDPRPGGMYRVEIDADNVARGEFVTVEPPRRLAFTWGWEAPAHPVPPGSSLVEVELLAKDGGTQVRLRHDGLPTLAVGFHEMGWDRYLPALRRSAESPRTR